MDRRANNQRYSIGTSINLSSPIPIAESTHLLAADDKNNSAQRSKRKPTSPLYSGAKSIFRSSSASALLNRIDPLVYTDAQSKGLTSRIVKYHEQNHKNHIKSSSNKNLYNKPGQFPIVHLKKTEIKNLPKRLLSSSSSVRIAPPKKSMFQNSVTRMGPLISTASIIMSSSSSSTAQKPLEVVVTSLDIDKNRNDNEPLTPSIETLHTKSALEALKEISRKRINSEELDVDRFKKQCKDLSEVDGPSDGSNKIDAPVASKRGRETNTVTGSNSTEQLQKKLCTKSNDILSSLSSSCFPKRTEQNRQQVANSQAESSDPGKSSSSTNELPVSQLLTADALKIAQKTYSEPVVSALSPAKTPKLTLFNVKYAAPQINQNYANDDDEDNESNKFIVPLNLNRAGWRGGDILRRVEKSKLKLMLNCLNDDLDEDAVDSAKEKLTESSETKTAAEVVMTHKEQHVTKAPEVTATTTAVIQTITPSPVTTTASLQISKATIKVVPTVPSLAPTFQLPVSSKEPSNEPTPAAQPQLNANLISFSPSPSFCTVTPSPATSTLNFTASNSLSVKTTPTITLPMPKPTTTASIITPKTLTFSAATPSFGVLGAADNTSTVTATIKLPSKTTESVHFGGIQNKSAFGGIQMSSVKTSCAPPPAYLSSGISSSATTVNPLSGIAFGATAVPAIIPTTTTVGGGFGFGSPAKPVANFAFGAASNLKSSDMSSTASNTTSQSSFGSTTTAPSFSFGGAGSQAQSSAASVSVTPSLFTTSIAKTTEATPEPISFSAFGSASTTEHKMASQPRTVGFSFGSSNSTMQEPQPQKIQTSMFGSPTTASVTNSASPLFNFSSHQQQQSQMQQIAAPQSAVSSNIFGSSNVQPTTNTTSIFGQKIGDGPTQAPNASVFGGGGIAPAPKFGASTNKPPPAYTTPSSVFGVPDNSNPTPSFAFGGSHVAQGAPQAGFGGSSFGGNSQVQNKSFSFAGPTSTVQNIFGSSTTAVTASTLTPSNSMTFGKPTQDLSGNASFNFSGPTNNNAAVPFAFKGPSENPSNLFPAYGGATSMGNTEKPAAFNFGGSPVPTQSANMFGNVASTPNLFANTDMNANNSFMAPNPFNMGGPAANSVQQQQQQQRRPMRQGTRRLNK